MPQYKNIAVFSRSTHYHFISGGMETQLKNLVEGLAKKGFGITVFTTSYPGKLDEDVVFTKNKVKYVFISNTTPGLYPMTLIDKFWKTLGFLDRKTVDIGNGNYFNKSVDYFNEYNGKDSFDLIISQSTSARSIIFKTDLPSISIIHGTIFAEIKNRIRSNRTFKNWFRFLFLDLPNWIIEKITINRKFFKKATSIVAVSDNLKKQFVYEYPGLSEKVTVIYNGVDSNLFVPGKRKRGFVFLYIGRVDREKGIDLILDATKDLLSKTNVKFKLNIIGQGIHFNELQNYNKQLGTDKVVEFLGAVKNEDIYKYYKEASAFVFPTRREEGHPMTVSECFCSGLPIIATSKGGLKDLIDDNVNGFLISENDKLALSEKMKLLLEDKKLLHNLSANAFKKGVKNYSQDGMIVKYNQLINNIL